MQIPAIEIAHKNEWIPFVVDANPEAPGLKRVDYFSLVDLKDKEGLLKAAKEFQKKFRLDGVFTVGTDFSTSVAYVADNLKLPSIGYEVALNATIKSRMRRCFETAHLASPPYCEISQEEDLDAIQLSYPLVLKPVDSMGARGVKLVRTPEEAKRHLNEAIRFSRSSRAIIEEYLPGREFSLDAVVTPEGEITICGLAERDIQFEPYFIEMGHTMPATLEPEEREEIETLFCRGIEALGIRGGAAKGDIRFSKKKAYITEIAGRLSGGYMSGWTFPLSSGSSSIFWAMQLALGLTPKIESLKHHCFVQERAFISIAGEIEKIDATRLQLEEAQGQRGSEWVPSLSATSPKALHGPASQKREVDFYFNNVSPNDSVDFPKSNVEKLANVISCDQSVESVTQKNIEALKALRYTLKPRNRETLRYLEKERAELVAYAFEIPPENQSEFWVLWESWSQKYSLDYETLVTNQAGNLPMGSSVHSLPQILSGVETLHDWHGVPLQEVWGETLERYNLTESSESDELFSFHLWNLVLRSSAQGIEWFFRSYT